jgi:hypothetical protein
MAGAYFRPSTNGEIEFLECRTNELPSLEIDCFGGNGIIRVAVRVVANCGVDIFHGLGI